MKNPRYSSVLRLLWSMFDLTNGIYPYKLVAEISYYETKVLNFQEKKVFLDYLVFLLQLKILFLFKIMF